MPTERHPFAPFLPPNAKMLMLGTFPPSPKRWCMEFYYPNFQNDMWRIFGLCFFGDKAHFVDERQRRFSLMAITEFLNERRIALYDVATEVVRTKNTASDKDLEIVCQTDLDALIGRLPELKAVVTAGELATSVAAARYGVAAPRVGEYSDFDAVGRHLRLYRMPSSSRAYPMRVEKKAEFYGRAFSFCWPCMGEQP